MGNNGITPKWETWTPNKAQKVLNTLNDKNRKVSPSKVNTYTLAMKAGEWRETLVPLIFDRNGELQDGQHRLRAIVTSECTIRFLTARGADPEDFAVIDRGLPRRAAQFLGPNGDKKVAAWKKVRGLTGTATPGSGMIEKSSDILLTLKDEQKWDAIFEKYMSEVHATSRRSKVPMTPLLAVVALAHKNGTNQHKIGGFLEGIRTGVGLAANDPRLLIMNQWRGSNRSLTVDESRALMYVVKAWNAYAKGKTMKQLKYSKGELFPKVL